MISNSSKYALKAVFFLSNKTDNNRKIMAKDVAYSINIPQAYTAKLLQKLSKKGIISSTRGPKGGFYISNENKRNTIMDIIEVIDENKNYNACILSIKNCDKANPCPLHKNIFQIKNQLLNIYKSTSIGELSDALDLKEIEIPELL